MTEQHQPAAPVGQDDPEALLRQFRELLADTRCSSELVGMAVRNYWGEYLLGRIETDASKIETLTLLADSRVKEVKDAQRAADAAEIARLTGALERIALLDEAGGHELERHHAFQAVAIASVALGKHPSEIAAGRRALLSAG